MEHTALDLRVVGSSPMRGTEMILKSLKTERKIRQALVFVGYGY